MTKKTDEGDDDEGEIEYPDWHWTKAIDKPGLWLQDRVAHQIEQELTKFYGLDANSIEEWKLTQGFKYLKDAIIKFPETE